MGWIGEWFGRRVDAIMELVIRVTGAELSFQRREDN